MSDAFDVGDGRDGRLFSEDHLVVRRAFVLESRPWERGKERVLVSEMLHLSEFEDADILAEKLNIRYYVR